MICFLLMWIFLEVGLRVLVMIFVRVDLLVVLLFIRLMILCVFMVKLIFVSVLMVLKCLVMLCRVSRGLVCDVVKFMSGF